LSLNVGAIRYTEQTLISDPVTQGELDQTVTAIEEDLPDLQFNGTIDTLVGIGGVITNLKERMLFWLGLPLFGLS
jgi:exopolyphosphatase/pppGpp-phosphohydrolase